MFTIEKLKLNRFEKVRIPSNKDYFARLGKQVLTSDNSYTGDDSAIMNQRKIEQIEDYQRYADMMDEQSKKSE